MTVRTKRTLQQLQRDHPGHLYRKEWDRWSADSSGLVVLDSTRILVPSSTRKEMLKRLHFAHQGIGRTKSRARGTLFWHGMMNDVGQMIHACDKCQTQRPGQTKEPLKTDAATEFPFQSVSMDLFEFGGQHFLEHSSPRRFITGTMALWSPVTNHDACFTLCTTENWSSSYYLRLEQKFAFKIRKQVVRKKLGKFCGFKIMKGLTLFYVRGKNISVTDVSLNLFMLLVMMVIQNRKTRLVELDKSSRHLTTLLMPFGRFRYCQVLIGLNPLGDQALSTLVGVRKIVNDILVCGDSCEDLLTKTEAVLSRCQQHGITLSKTKIYFTLSSNSALDTLSKNATDDINYQAVVSTLLSGQSPKSLPQSHTSKFLSKQWGDLSFVKDTGLLILRGHRIVFPAKSRLDVLSSLLTSHPGIRGTCALARSIYFWPRMYNNIEQVVSSGSTCQLRLSSQQHEPLVHSTSSRPFEAISVDIFESTSAHTHYLIMAHRFLGWLCIARLSWMDTKTVTDILRDWFVDYVIPQFICYDGGPQFPPGGVRQDSSRFPIAWFPHDSIVAERLEIPADLPPERANIISHIVLDTYYGGQLGGVIAPSIGRVNMDIHDMDIVDSWNTQSSFLNYAQNKQFNGLSTTNGLAVQISSSPQETSCSLALGCNEVGSSNLPQLFETNEGFNDRLKQAVNLGQGETTDSIEEGRDKLWNREFPPDRQNISQSRFIPEEFLENIPDIPKEFKHSFRTVKHVVSACEKVSKLIAKEEKNGDPTDLLPKKMKWAQSLLDVWQLEHHDQTIVREELWKEEDWLGTLTAPLFKDRDEPNSLWYRLQSHLREAPSLDIPSFLKDLNSHVSINGQHSKVQNSKRITKRSKILTSFLDSSTLFLATFFTGKVLGLTGPQSEPMVQKHGTLLGNLFEENVFHALKDTISKRPRWITVFCGLVVLGNKQGKNEFDFLIILGQVMKIIYVECKYTLRDYIAMKIKKQSNNAFEYLQFYLPVTKGWEFLTWACFEERASAPICSKCRPFLVPISDLETSFNKILNERESNAIENGTSKKDYEDLVKTYLFHALANKQVFEGSQVAKHQLKMVDFPSQSIIL
eukprot:TCALIF_09941-PA protein Name:"Similar to K02A2.6 Uncharacterized protein K02A2.6 (Caenorhabditis elegans)" AED:0.44 eAED:0.51 QI:0/0/0/0.6/0.11/0.3/10/0/1087